MAGNLRYVALGIYAGLVSLWSIQGTLTVDTPEKAALVLGPVVGILAVDYWKHKDDNKK